MKSNELRIGSVLNYINLFLSLSSGIFLTPFIIRALGQNEFGLLHLIGAFAGYLYLFEFGIGTTITRYVAKYRAENNIINIENILAFGFIINIFISLLILVTGLILFFNIEYIFKNSLSVTDIISAKIMFAMILGNMIIGVLCSIFPAALSGYEKFIIPKLISIVFTSMRIITTLYVLSVGPKAIYMTSVTVGFGILTILSNLFYAKFKVKIRVKLHYMDWNLLKEVGIFSFFNFLQTLMSQIYWKLDEIIIGITLSTAMVAIYAVAMSINNYVLNITTAVTQLILPKATFLSTRNASVAETTDFMSRIGRIILILYGGFLLGITFLGKEFIRLWAGDNYTDAYYIILIIIYFAALPRIQSAANSIMKAKNMHSFLTTIYVITGVINIFLTILFIKRWGLIGAAWGTAFSLFIGNTLIANIYFQKKLGINVKRFFIKTFDKLAISITISAIICYFISSYPNGGWGVFVIKCILFSVFYILSLILVGFNDYEKKLIKSLLRIPGGA
ncbi:MAG: polysaccharide biosynthesis C-terminal domain-containing protein [Candidatus Delongbacteria bacterium]|nr:polysaccharide biosynthesis C-terminal domain-containing protein [Candidatus Delongbacteria bacterium]